MNLYSIILCNDGKYNNQWDIIKDQYDNDVLINESISQKIKVGKYLKPTLSLTYTSQRDFTSDGIGEDIFCKYNFSDDGHYVINKKNFTLTMIKNSKDDADKFSNKHLIYVTVSTDRVKIVEAEVNLDYAEIINSYRSNGMNGGVIEIDTSKFTNPPVTIGDNLKPYEKFKTEEIKIGWFILYNTEATDESKKIIKKDIILRRDLSSVYVTTEYITSGLFKEEAESVAESNFFKKISISPTKEIRTSVYLVNENKVNKFNDMYPDSNDVTILSINPKILESKNKENVEALEAAIQNHIVKNKVRAITVVGIKLPKEFYAKYKILLCFVHDLNTGIIKCIKS